MADTSRVVVESSSPFVFVGCCAYLDSLSPTQPSTVYAIRPREPDFSLFCVARDEGTVTFREHAIHYRVESSPPLPTDTKPEPFRRLALTTDADRDVLLEFVRVAIERHRWRVTAPRGQPGVGVMRYVWDEDSQCWDSGKLVPPRPLDTMYLPGGVVEDVSEDLGAYLKRETLEKYAALHIAPVRVYMLHGVPGSGKTSLVHCLASETGSNLAVLNFRQHTTDHDIAMALRSLPPQCFLCIEDIDCVFESRANKNHGVSFASLLAALDGAYDTASTNALTVFMTTNALDALDAALRRRVDYAVDFTFATSQQCKRMFQAYFPDHIGFESLWAHISKHKFSTSVFQKFLVRCLQAKDPVACVETFDSIVQCTYGEHHQSSPAMYS